MARRPHLLALLLLIALAIPVAVPPAAMAAEATITRQESYPVVPGLRRSVLRVKTDAGGVDVHVLHARLDEPTLSFRPVLARDTVSGLETTMAAVERAGEGGIAGVNGGYFDYSADPLGDPSGLLLVDGEYVSQPERAYDWTWRGAFGVGSDGQVLVGRPGFLGDVYIPSNAEGEPTKVAVTAVNRRPRAQTPSGAPLSELTILSPRFGSHTGTQEGTVEVVLQNVQVQPRMFTTAVVDAVNTTGNSPIPAGGVVLSATRTSAGALIGLVPGDEIQLNLEITEGWEGLRHALAAGPLILQDGARVPRYSWEREGFNPVTHSDRRHPRTAIASTGSGELLLVTADGRRSTSAGLSIGELLTLLEKLGARDAVVLDGGGSTTMVADRVLMNRPSDGNMRSVASNLVLTTTVRTPGVLRLSGEDRYATAASVAAEGWPSGATEVLLAAGGSFPDGLAGGPLAARMNAPLLFTRPEALPGPTVSALRSLQPRRVTILGGHAAVHETVVDQLRGLGYDVRRIWGDTREATAAAIAGVHRARSGRAFLVASRQFPDALSAALPASLADAPLFLTRPDGLAPEVFEIIDALGIREILIGGGEAAVPAEIEQQLQAYGVRTTRIAGPDRWATSAALARWAVQNVDADPTRLVLANGLDFPDALAGGPYAAARKAPVLLSHPYDDARSPATKAWIDDHPLHEATILGGRTAMSTWLAVRLQEAKNRAPLTALPR